MMTITKTQIINLTDKNNTMANMAYCRFENTYNDLLDCYEHFEEPKNDSEKEYRYKLLKLAKQIVNEYSTED
jgi:hypothetical protein